MSTEHELTQVLADQADRFSRSAEAGVSVDGVLARAGEIKRGRRMRATIAMAAVVLAVAVPVGVKVVGDETTSKPPVPAQQDHSGIGLEGLETGKAPALAYAEGPTLHLTHGDAPLPWGGRASYFAQVRGSYLVGITGIDSTGVQILASDGRAGDKSWAMQGGFAVSPDSRVGAFTDELGRVWAVEDGRADTIGHVFPTPHADGAGFSRLPFEAVAVEGSSCGGTAEAAECTIYVNQTDDHPKVWAVTPHAEPQVVRPGLIRLTDISVGGLFAGYTEIKDDGSCSAVHDASDAVLWQTCDHRLSTFSPDGKHLLAAGPYGDGAGDSDLTILDARTGDVRLDLHTTGQAVVTQAVWEDDDHVLAVVLEGDRSAIVRFDLRGNRSAAVAPVKVTDDFVSPFLLAQQ